MSVPVMTEEQYRSLLEQKADTAAGYSPSSASKVPVMTEEQYQSLFKPPAKPAIAPTHAEAEGERDRLRYRLLDRPLDRIRDMITPHGKPAQKPMPVSAPVAMMGAAPVPISRRPVVDAEGPSLSETNAGIRQRGQEAAQGDRARTPEPATKIVPFLLGQWMYGKPPAPAAPGARLDELTPDQILNKVFVESRWKDAPPLDPNQNFVKQAIVEGFRGGVQRARALVERASYPLYGDTEKIIRQQRERERELAEIQEAMGPVKGTAARTITGTVQSLVPVLAGAAVAGPVGAIGVASAMEMNEAIVDGLDKGLSGEDLTKYVLRAGLIEAAPATVMQSVGLGGVEKVAAALFRKKPARDAFVVGFKGALKRAGINLLAEIPEELVTEVGHQVNAYLSGVDPDALEPDQIMRVVMDTTLQTIVTMGLLSSPYIVQQTRLARKNRELQQQSAQAEQQVGAFDEARGIMLPPHQQGPLPPAPMVPEGAPSPELVPEPAAPMVPEGAPSPELVPEPAAPRQYTAVNPETGATAQFDTIDDAMAWMKQQMQAGKPVVAMPPEPQTAPEAAQAEAAEQAAPVEQVPQEQPAAPEPAAPAPPMPVEQTAVEPALSEPELLRKIEVLERKRDRAKTPETKQKIQEQIDQKWQQVEQLRQEVPHDRETKGRVLRPIGEREEPGRPVPEPETGKEAAEAGGVLQEPISREEVAEEAAPVERAAPEAAPAPGAAVQQALAARMSKAKINSYFQMHSAIAQILRTEEYSDRKKNSERTRHLHNKAWETIRLHAKKLGIEIPKRSGFFDPDLDVQMGKEIQKLLPAWEVIYAAKREGKTPAAPAAPVERAAPEAAPAPAPAEARAPEAAPEAATKTIAETQIEAMEKEIKRLEEDIRRRHSKERKEELKEEIEKIRNQIATLKETHIIKQDEFLTEKEIVDWVIKQLDILGEQGLPEGKTRARIITNDGREITISNLDRENIIRIKKSIRANWPTGRVEKAKGPSLPSTIEKKLPPVRELNEKTASVALDKFKAEQGVGSKVYSDGKRSYASDGPTALMVNLPVRGAAEIEKSKVSKALKIEEEAQKVGVLTEDLMRPLSIAKGQRGVVFLYRNSDGSIGLWGEDTKFNVQPDARLLGSFSANFLHRAWNAMRSLGDAEPNLAIFKETIGKSESRTVVLKGKNATALVAEEEVAGERMGIWPERQTPAEARAAFPEPEVQQAIQEAQDLGIDVQVLETQEEAGRVVEQEKGEAPRQATREAFIKGNRMWLVRDQLKDKPKRAVEAIREEVGHHILEQTEAGRQAVTEAANELMTNEDRAALERAGYRGLSPDALAHEFLAKTRRDGNRGLLRRIADRVIQKLAKLPGIGKWVKKSGANREAIARALMRGAEAEYEAGRAAERGAGDLRYALAYHGTPHQWQPEPGFPHGRFRLDKIGTGEGAQAYGWGAYFAEKSDVAKSYTPRQEGQLYKLDIPDDVIPKLLDWDSPYALQPKAVKEALRKAGVMKLYKENQSDFSSPANTRGQSRTGAQIYAFLGYMALRYDGNPINATFRKIAGTEKSADQDRAASEFLASIGIPGNKYLDQQSRDYKNWRGDFSGYPGKPTFNYVIWDQKVLDRIALLKRNEERLDAITVRQNEAVGKEPMFSLAPTEQEQQQAQRSGLQVFGLPELHRLMRSLTGKPPAIKRRLGNALGKFKYGGSQGAEVLLKADIYKGPVRAAITSKRPFSPEDVNAFRDRLIESGVPEDKVIIDRDMVGGKHVLFGYERDHTFAAKTAAHEIGHAWNYFPKETMKSGNVLGRIGNLVNHLQDTLGEFPGEPSLTRKERNRLRYKAKKMAEQQLKGSLASKEDYQALCSEIYNDLLVDEIRSRGMFVLHDLESGGDRIPGVFDELRALSRWWNPIPDNATEGYITYRMSGKEVFADAISVLLNNPNAFKERAPQTWAAFHNHMKAKPEVQALYDSIQADLQKGVSPNKTLDALYAAVAQGEDIARDREVERNRRGRVTMRGIVNWVGRTFVRSTIDIPNPRHLPGNQNPRTWTTEIVYQSARTKWYYQGAFNDVLDRLIEGGATEADFNVYLQLKRAETERKDIANPAGVRGEDATATLDALRERIGDDAFKALEAAADKWWEWRQKFLIKPLLESGVMDNESELVKKIQSNRFYVRYVLQDLAERGAVHHDILTFHKQIGTEEDIMPVFSETLLYDALLAQAIVEQQGRRALGEFYGDTVEKAERRWKGNHWEFVKPADPDLDLLTWMQNGEMQGVYLPKETVWWYNADKGGAHAAVKIIQAIVSPSRAITTTYNPFFGPRNFLRDIMAAQIQFSEELLPVRLLASYAIAAPSAYREAMGRPDALVSRALEHRILIEQRYWGTKDSDDPRSRIQRIRDETGLASRENRSLWQKIISPLNVENRFFEVWSKLAALDYAEKKGWMQKDPMKTAERIRNLAGSPDFLAGGTAKAWYNNIWMFSNAKIQGYVSVAEAIRENPKLYAMKSMLYHGIPFLLKMAAANGVLDAIWPYLFGDDDDKDWTFEDFFRRITDHEKANYNIIPLGITSEGEAMRIVVPLEHFGQFVSQMLFATAAQFKRFNPSQIAEEVWQEFPFNTSQFAPAIQALVDWGSAAVGRMPKDWRGNPIVDNLTFRAGGAPMVKQLGKHTWNQLLGPVYRLDEGMEPVGQSRFSRLVSRGFLGTAMRGYFRVDKRGLDEAQRKEEAVEEGAMAIQAVHVRDKVILPYIRELPKQKNLRRWKIESNRAWYKAKREGKIPKGYTKQRFDASFRFHYERRFARPSAQTP